MRARLLAPVAILSLLPFSAHAAPPSRLGPIVRVTTPGTAGCHTESEPALAITSAGTWVGYNDLGLCQAADAALGNHITFVQLLPAAGGSARVVPLPPLELGWGYVGDPALAADADGRGVVLTSLAANSTPQVGTTSVSSVSLRLEVLRISAAGAVQRLPAASGPTPFDDKEAVAVDRSGRIYVTWDESSTNQVSLRVFDGRRWLPTRQVYPFPGGRPDVAVSAAGRVAVAYETGDGVEVRAAGSHDKALGRSVLAIPGADPGHVDSTCPLINAVGVRQRVIRSPRMAWDTRGRLHLVAAVGSSLNVTPTAAGSVESTIVHAVSLDAGRSWTRTTLTETTAWAPSIAALPNGAVAVGYLALADAAGSTFTARLWRSDAGTVELSQGAASLSVGSESTRSNYCYGLGDYTGTAARGADVAFAWGSTAGAARPGYDTDVLVRHLRG